MKKQPKKSIEKTLAVLEAFLKDGRDEIGITALVELTGLNVSTIHRIASVLVGNGYLAQPHPRAKYSLGPKFLLFGGVVSSRMKVRELAVPALEGLNRAVNESVNLAILDGHEAVYAYCLEPVETKVRLRIFTQVGARVPLYCTGVGKVLLANMSEDERQTYLDQVHLTSRTKNTVTDRARLRRELSLVKKQGFAVDDEEMELGVRCLAAPIKDFKGTVIAAASISGPSTRITPQRIEQLVPMLNDCVVKISAAAGYRAAPRSN